MLFHVLWRMGAFLCQHEASKIKNTIVWNSFSAVVYTAGITHTIEKPLLRFLSAQKNVYPLVLHERAPLTVYYWDYTPFCPNGTSYSAVVLYKVKRRHCYCTPCSVYKREKFDQFKLCMKIFRLNTILLAWLNDFILGSMRNVKKMWWNVSVLHI